MVDGVNEDGAAQGPPVLNGKGSYKHIDGSEYDGDWKDGKRHGYGIFKNKTHIYEGEWVDDAPHGKVHSCADKYSCVAFVISLCCFIRRVSMFLTEAKYMREIISGERDKALGSIHMQMVLCMKVKTSIQLNAQTH